MFNILISDDLAVEGLDLLKTADDVEFAVRTSLSEQQLLAEMPGRDALIVRSGTHVNRQVIKAGANLKVIGRAGIGVDNIDIGTATERGVLVMNSPRAIAIATAEHTMALLLAASRQLVRAHASLGRKEWRRDDFQGSQLQGKRLGIIGFGRIGRLVAKRAQAFGLIVSAYDPFVTEDRAGGSGVELQALEPLLAQSDYISLHAAITPESKGIINQQAFIKMKTGVIIINTSRGGFIDEPALAEALASGKVKAAALDVYDREPPENSPLIGMNNVIHTPHLGASTAEAQKDVATEIVSQVLDALRGVSYQNVINTELLSDYR
ncbi:MAG TPA: hydroxyacid dehydrogenase [candidate division Zixibacteria bacterium]|nr:hydroxyacid dehydrogenase [candidate division Zixibacteria bacterium]